MITEFFIDLFNKVIQWFVSLFGTAEPPEWIKGVSGFFTEMFARASGLGAWIPFVMIGVVGASVFGIWFVLWLVKLIRWGWGLTPLSGGS